MKEFLIDIALLVMGILTGFVTGHILWMLGTKIKKWINKYKEKRFIKKLSSPYQRYKIYIKIRNDILDTEKDEYPFICPRLKRILYRNNINIFKHPLEQLFPELLLVKPEDKSWRIAWWPEKDKQSRINALDKMIYEVLEKGNKL